MKYIFVVLMMPTCLGLEAQQDILPIDPATNLISFSEVVIVSDSATKNELFSRAKMCFVYIFKNSKSVIQMEDKDAGVIIGKGSIKAYARALGTDYEGGFVNFTITLACKDGRYKYTLTDFIHEGTGSKMPSGGKLENESVGTWTRNQWNMMKSQTSEEVKDLIISIKAQMNKSTPQNDNW